jgi:putative ABC transport system substrate-binding protein
VLLQRLRELGWTDGRNLRIEIRFAGSNPEDMRAYAKEVAALAPDVILVQSNPGLVAMLDATRTIPIVFVQVADPVTGGFITSLAHPGGNITGFTNFESSMGSKWLEVLKEIAPGVTRAAVMLHPETAAHVEMLRAAQTASRSFGIAVTAAGVHDAAEIGRSIAAFAADSNGGLIVLPHVITAGNRVLIAELALRHRLPSVSAFRFMAEAGGLVSYGINVIDLFRQAAVYIDRILRGAQAGELPVQAPDKFELVINLKTARSFGLTVPSTLLARADEVIE